MAKANKDHKPSKRIFRGLRLCNKCNTVWEMQYQDRKVLYYLEFPTYGLERLKCNRCASIEK